MQKYGRYTCYFQLSSGLFCVYLLLIHFNFQAHAVNVVSGKERQPQSVAVADGDDRFEQEFQQAENEIKVNLPMAYFSVHEELLFCLLGREAVSLVGRF